MQVGRSVTVRRPMHPLRKQIERSKREKKITNEQIADFLFVDVRTIYRKLAKPEKFTVDELEDLARLFNWRNQTLSKFTEA